MPTGYAVSVAIQPLWKSNIQAVSFLIGTKGIVGRATVSAIDSATISSLSFVFTHGFMEAPANLGEDELMKLVTSIRNHCPRRVRAANGQDD